MCERYFHNKCKPKRPELGIVSAFLPELSRLLESFEERFKTVEHGGTFYFHGIVKKVYIVCAVSGIGMVNAAMVTQAMIDLFKPKRLLYSGIAGGVNPENPIGTLIFYSRVAQFDHQKAVSSYIDNNIIFNTYFDTFVDFPNKYPTYQNNKIISSLRASCLGCNNPDGQPPPFDQIVGTTAKTTGMNILMEVEAFRKGSDAFQPSPPSKLFFDSDPSFLSLVQRIIASGIVLPKEICVSNNCYTPIVKIGDVAGSSSIFLSNAEYRDHLATSFQNLGATLESVDMESAAFAHCAYSNRVPFLIMRSVSDLAGGDADVQIGQFLGAVTENNHFVVLEIIRQLQRFANSYC